MSNSKRVDAGRKAKLDGHIMEKSLAEIRTEETGMQYYTDGAKNTKVDIYAGNHENPIAAETPESGIGTTTSASILFSMANCSPNFFLYVYTVFPSIILSGLAK